MIKKNHYQVNGVVHTILLFKIIWKINKNMLIQQQKVWLKSFKYKFKGSTKKNTWSNSPHTNLYTRYQFYVDSYVESENESLSPIPLNDNGERIVKLSIPTRSFISMKNTPNLQLLNYIGKITKQVMKLLRNIANYFRKSSK